MAAMLMHLCAHPNVVPVTLLGLQAPASPLTPLDPCQVAYFGMPMADLSLEKRMGYVGSIVTLLWQALCMHHIVTSPHIVKTCL